MGRWFGFRPSYRDLVRVFLGVVEGKNGSLDLVSSFKEVCRMEERFRDELKRYVRRLGAPKITPRQIPPLISISGNLRPTSRNKMFNATIANKNFGGSWAMPTLTASQPDNIGRNIIAANRLLSAQTDLGRKILGGSATNGNALKVDSRLFQVSNGDLCAFLRSFRWLEEGAKSSLLPTDIGLQIEFLEKQDHGIESWLILAPQRQSSFGPPLRLDGVGAMAVKERHRIPGRGFQVFGESSHRMLAQFLAEIEEASKPRLASPNDPTKGMRNKRRGIVLLYLVRENEKDKLVSVGFELLFPENSLPFDLNFTVARSRDRQRIVVSAIDG
jgi:hypothetical protein